MGSVLMAAVSERERASVFSEDKFLVAYCKASAKARPSLPGGLHYKRMEDFLQGHSVKNHQSHYLEFLVNGCLEN